MRTKALIPSLMAALALAAAGFGGSSNKSAGATGSGGSGADVVPASAPVFVSINSDLSSAQWKTLGTLSDKFPGKAGLIAQAKASLQKQGVDWDKDIKPALGPEIDIAVLSLSNGASDTVVLTQPKDEAKLNAALDKGSPPHPVHETVNGWTVYANSQSALDAYKSAQSGDKLSKQSSFTDAMASLEPDAVAKLYVNGTAITQAAANSTSSTGGIDTASLVGKLQWIAASAVATDNGLKIQGNVKSDKTFGGSKSYTAKLPDALPSGALVYLSFSDLASGLKSALDQVGKSVPNFQKQKAQLEQALGFTVDKDLLPLFADEGAVAVYSGTPIPTVDVVLTVSDATKAASILDRLGALANLAGGGAVKPVTIGGLAAKQLSFGSFSIYYAGFDGKLAISSTDTGLAALHGSGTKLSADPLYKDARTAASVPDSTNGFLYVNLQEGASSLLSLASLAGTTNSAALDQVRANTAPLQSFFIYSTQKNGITSGTGFLGIK